MINVCSPISLCPVPPVFIIEPEEVEILEGLSAIFSCAATGLPRPKITWYTHNESDAPESVNVSDVRVTVTEVVIGGRELMSNLTLRSVLPSDAAFYDCVAENVVMDVMSNDTGILTVNGKGESFDTLYTTVLLTRT